MDELGEDRGSSIYDPSSCEQKLNIIKEVSGAVGRQAKVANIYWIAFIVFAISFLTNVFNEKDDYCCYADGLKFPFGLGVTNPALYYMLSFVILCSLMLVFCAAHIQEQRAGFFAQDHIDGKYWLECNRDEEYYRKYYDFIRTPTFCRVGPISQVLYLHKEIILPKPSHFRWNLASTAFIVVKLFSTIIYMIIPIAIIVWSYYKTTSYDLAAFVFAAPLITLFVVFCMALYVHCVAALRTFDKIGEQYAKKLSNPSTVGK